MRHSVLFEIFLVTVVKATGFKFGILIDQASTTQGTIQQGYGLSHVIYI